MSGVKAKERMSIGFKFEEHENLPFEVRCNFEDPYDLKAHQLCLFFEKTQIGFKLIQSKSSIEVRVNGQVLSLQKLMHIAQQGVLHKVVAGERCMDCLKKIHGGPKETNLNRCSTCLK